MAEDRVEYARTMAEAESALARVLATAEENGHIPFLGVAVIRGDTDELERVKRDMRERDLARQEAHNRQWRALHGYRPDTP